MGLNIDNKARSLLDRTRRGRGVLITVVGNYGLPGEMLTVERCDVARAERDPDLIRLEPLQGVPIYAYSRIAPYVRWHSLRLTAHGLPWWPSLAIDHAATAWHDLVRWEYTHPGIARHAPAA